MSDVTKLIHEYLRHNKKFPHVFCAGCGHGIVLGSLVRSVHALQLQKDNVVLVAGIGCSGRMAVYVDFNTVHTAHGRALTFATGIKMANPELNVICVMGDGDALSIGGNHLIHAARRNIGVTALILNNQIYGMTGGQCSPATPQGDLSMTSPYGSLEQPFDTVELAKAAGANFVARSTSFHANQLDKLMQQAILHPGFSVLEALSPCPTQYGRKNKFRHVVDMYNWLKKNTVKVENRKEGDTRIPTGIFQNLDRPGLEDRYDEMRKSLQAEE
ncbi:2-oxoacid:ferredoxin oxidoreductase subunit beta [Halodesulfovibrio sp. MK-HDV]|jgi:2-oxoglutarate/2-oxoacid ferredoxin oxidoreductase subunit beta|uniref:2-oxoacid:ferredoxin oxidoreductase subunit beta n=1 Tax=Halodesulfovibrio sp. MK-HDV TaxID=2599925 RepID=UPI00136A34C9|nr:2-oxoacid:ferredoxin oxidoreductase subunit beta [Halodesulfovibrio sp. MK-HDV]KAF1075711.1 2-oxoglutarate oxidoreductase subunit KorB [Halodesulfovibrio sp. MK-HDV]